VVAIALQFIWPYLTQSEWACLWDCNVCHSTKNSHWLSYGLLQPLPIPATCVWSVSSNITTKWPDTARNGYDCITAIGNPLANRV
jgi:hypothetical protein